MFNRQLQVKLIKSKKEDAAKASQTDHTYEGKGAIFGYYLERAIDKAGRAAITYIVLDTVRQVMVARIQKQ